jgi:cobaltochelatase CobT
VTENRSFFEWFSWLFSPAPAMPKRYEGAYRIYTTGYDQVLRFTTSDDLRARVTFYGAHDSLPFHTYLNDCVDLYDAAAQRLVANVPADLVADMAVTFLLDHSGSLRGEPSQRLAATVGIASECLSRLNVAHEVLAFTTSSWKGGKSFADWKHAELPKAPGRLCDILHIIYRAFDDSGPLSYEALEQMTQPWLLKENIDGEALAWAAERLRVQPASRRILVVISDGAPVDDKTLLANGPNILDDHLRLVAADLIRAQEIEIYGLGIGYAMHRYYPQYAVLCDKQDIASVALPVLTAILTSSAHAPSPAQATGPG